MHWLDTYYGRMGDPGATGPGTQPITYTGMSTQIPITTTASNPIPVDQKAIVNQAKQQALDKAAPANVATKITGYGLNVYNALKTAGFKDPALQFVYLMCYMESGAWTNGPTVKDNNPGNIMMYKGATKGTYIAANKTYAAHFASLSQFAAKLYSLLSRGSRPVDATDLTDFVHRLKGIDYFGKQSESSYLSAMQGAAQRLRLIADLDNDTHQKIVKDAGVLKTINPLWYLAAGVGGLILLNNLTK